MSKEIIDELDQVTARIFKETQTKLPEVDRADPDGTYCLDQDNNYKCTKTVDHKGDHCAHGVLGYIVHRWKRA